MKEQNYIISDDCDSLTEGISSKVDLKENGMEGTGQGTVNTLKGNGMIFPPYPTSLPAWKGENISELRSNPDEETKKYWFLDLNIRKTENNHNWSVSFSKK